MMADSARVRENVAFIIAGGISNVTRAPMQVPDPSGGVRQVQLVRFSLAFSLAFSKTEFGRQHQFEAKVTDADGIGVAEAKGNIVLPPVPPNVSTRPGTVVIPTEVTQIISMDVQFEVKQPGPHSVDIFTNGQLAKQIGFTVL